MDKANRFSNMANKLYSPGKDNSIPKETDLSTNSDNKGSIKAPEEKTETTSKTSPLTKTTPKTKTITKPSKKNATIKVSATKKNSTSGEKEKRGRKAGTVLVKKEDQKKSISISVDPKDEELYKKIVQKNKKRFRNLSYLVELALDEYIKKNKLS